MSHLSTTLLYSIEQAPEAHANFNLVPYGFLKSENAEKVKYRNYSLMNALRIRILTGIEAQGRIKSRMSGPTIINIYEIQGSDGENELK